MNTYQLDAVLDHRNAVGGKLTWEDRGAIAGDERWCVVYSAPDPEDASKTRLVAGYGPTREDAARGLAQQL